MMCLPWKPTKRPPSRGGAVLGLLLLLLLLPSSARTETAPFSFADGQIRCEVKSAEAPIPELLHTSLPTAMKVALQEVGCPKGAALLTIQIKGKPSVTERIQSFFQAEAFAIQEGDTLQLHLSDNPLKLTFRLAHEFSHWLIAQQYPARPPLWLDEGLANNVGAKAAAATARTLSQQVERPVPEDLEETGYSLAELTALEAYPTSEGRIAAFYWQAETLVRALRKRLGTEAFTTYLGLLSSPDAPDWQLPLRERWYFTDGDLEWLARQILSTDAALPPDSQSISP